MHYTEIDNLVPVILAALRLVVMHAKPTKKWSVAV